MAFLFGGGRVVDKDGGVRECERQVGRNVRATERELLKLDSREKLALRELRASGAKRDMEAARLKATELVRLRAHRARLASLRANMVGLSQGLGEIAASHRTQEMVGKTALMLGKLNAQLDLPSAARMVAVFERESAQMGMKQEVIHDALDEAFAEEGEAGLTDQAVEQVLAEAGFEESLLYAQSRPPPRDVSMEELEQRLNALRAP
jgi:charged multivesicular body protein 2A